MIGCASLSIILLIPALLFFGISSATTSPVAQPPVEATAAASTPAVAATPAVVATPAANAPTLSISALPRLEPAATGQELVNRFVEAFDLAVSAGAHGNYSSWTWSALEPTPGQFALNDVNNGINYAGNARGLTLHVTISVLNTTAKETPADLKNVPFDSQQMKDRFHALIDAIAPYFNHHVATLSIGNEVDVYLAAHNEWAAYKDFYEDALTYVHRSLPWIKVGVTTTFAGATGASANDVAALNAMSDVYVFTYYPTGDGFAVRPPDSPLTDFPKLVALANGHPVILQEVGYPASELLSSSEQKQADFVTNVFKAWKAANGNIPFLNYFLLHDFTQKMCDDFTQYYGLPGNQPFNAFLCTLGLRKADGTPRLAWKAFVEGGTATG